MLHEVNKGGIPDIFDDHPIEKFIIIGDHCSVIGKRKFDQWVAVVGNSGNNGLGKISEVAKPGGISERYDYDNYSRISAITESIDNQDFLESFLYNGNGQLSQLNYPSGFSVKYKYNNLGYLTEITTADSALWQAISMNERDQYTQFKTGSDLTTTHEFTHGLLTGIHTGSLQYYNYTYDYGSGNMTQRSDVNRNISESFSYDNLNRLTHSAVF